MAKNLAKILIIHLAKNLGAREGIFSSVYGMFCNPKCYIRNNEKKTQCSLSIPLKDPVKGGGVLFTVYRINSFERPHWGRLLGR